MTSETGLPLTRRHLLKASAALAGGAFFLPAVLLQPSAAGLPAMAIGDMEITVVSDGLMNLPFSYMLPQTPLAEVVDLFAAHGLPTDAVHADCNVTVLKAGERLVLFDAGAGPAFMATTGRLAANLAAAGIEAAAVTDVIFTHAHPDHIWGVLDDFDELLFPRATYRISQVEWDFWRAETTLANMPEDRKTLVVGARNRFAMIERRVEFFAGGDEIIAGVEAVATPGHTPGHAAFVVHGGGDGVMIIGDAISNVVASFDHPQWRWGSDHDGEHGAATRVRLLDRLAADRIRTIGFHLPYPGYGLVERKGPAYRFAPAA